MSPKNALQFSSQINSSTASQLQDTSSESGNEEEPPTFSGNRDIEVVDMGTSQSEDDESISTSAELSPETAQLRAGLKTFRMLLAEFSGKSLYNCIRWVKHQPYLSAVPKENKIAMLEDYWAAFIMLEITDWLTPMIKAQIQLTSAEQPLCFWELVDEVQNLNLTEKINTRCLLVLNAMSVWFNTNSIHEVTSNSLVSRVRDVDKDFIERMLFNNMFEMPISSVITDIFDSV